MKTLRFLLLCLLACATASARLGETEVQCAARYGTPVKKKEGGATYRKNGIVVDVMFVSGKCALISFSPAPDDASFLSLSPEQVQELLAANGGGKEWQRTVSVGDLAQWKLSDGESFAQWNKATATLTLHTIAFAQAKEVKDRAAALERVKGF